MPTKASAVIVAAGEGLRVGGEIPKVYLPLAGRPMLLRTLDQVFAAKSISEVIVVAAANELARCEVLLRADDAIGSRSWSLQTGGSTRQESVRQGLAKVSDRIPIVAIHDGARPFASAALFDRCVAAAAEKGAVIPGVPPRDTIKLLGAAGFVESTPSRAALRLIQTPQVFRCELIKKAHEAAAAEGFEATDDAMLVERMGTAVHVIDGEKFNFKITMPEDLWLAETLIRERKID